MQEQVDILGIRFQKKNAERLIKDINESLFKEKCFTIFTPNAEIALQAYNDKRFKEILNSASLLLPDGIGIVLASRILGSPIPERISGIDTGERILYMANEKRLKLYLLGGTKESVSSAARRISKK